MGRIKKAAGPKHEATVVSTISPHPIVLANESLQSPAIAEFVTKAASLPVATLPKHLESFPHRWPFPRGDLYHWIPLLNRFDQILEQIVQEYGLQNGPQTLPFGRRLLEKGVTEEGKDEAEAGTCPDALDKLSFAPDGDKDLVLAILSFARQLLENCGNRSLYNSSDRIGHLLNTIDVSLLESTLQLAVRLAQRFHASKQRGANASQHLNNALLASHYNIDLNKVQCLANPFSKSTSSGIAEVNVATSGKSAAKGKLKSRSSATQQSTIQPSDLVALAGGHTSQANGNAGKRKSFSPQQETPQWEGWGSVQLKYYQTPSNQLDSTKATTPTTPTPAHRTSNLSRPSRLSNSEESSDPPAASSNRKAEETTQGGMKNLEIPFSKISSKPIHEILKETLPELPKESHYELLSKLRVARAMTTSVSTRQELLTVRLLSLTNLAYVYPDASFQQKVLQPDSDEPRRLQLAYQLAELLQPPGNGGSGIPLDLQTVALGALESLTKHKSRAPDVCAALNINVNHGVLFQTLKRAAADLTTEDDDEGDAETDHDHWHEAIFSLLEALPPSTPRTGDTLIAAGLFDILIEMLNLRTGKAERYHHKVLTFLNSIVYNVRDAFQTLANAKGLDTISELVAHEVSSSLERARDGQGIPVAFRNQNIDYQIPFFQQQSLRWLFKFVNHMMSHGGGNFDRLLRNLIDSPQLLGGLKTVIINAKIFGSSAWSGAVNILSAFIHNEPTSYGIIAESGLSKGFLEAVSSEPISEAKNTKENGETSVSTEQNGDEVGSGPASSSTPAPNTEAFELELQQRRDQLAQGILPATDAILTIPQAFGAICLNNAGLELLLQSRAMERFFEIFESAEHMKSMTNEVELPRLLGSSFDELVRHYPQLKQPIMLSVMLMVGRVCRLCKSRATEQGLGAKLWVDAGNGKPEVAGGIRALRGEDQTNHLLSRQDSDVVMGDANIPNEGELAAVDFDQLMVDTKSDELTATYIGTAMKFLGGFFENTNICSSFVDAGGVELVLEFSTLPSLQHDFKTQGACQELARVIHMLVEQKPHIVMPSLIRRTQAAANGLEPFCSHTDSSAYFEEYTSSHEKVTKQPHNSTINGTQIMKSLVTVHLLTNILVEAFASPIFNARSSHTVFTQVNLTDMYIKLISSLGKLHRVCIWEEIQLIKAMPGSWREATILKGYGIGSQEADHLGLQGLLSAEEFTPGDSETAQRIAAHSTVDAISALGTSIVSSNQERRQSSVRKDESLPEFQNVRALLYLLSHLPDDIALFFQYLGKALIAKRRPDSYARQNAYMVADALSAALLEQIAFQSPRESKTPEERHSYWIVALTSISHVLVEGGSNAAAISYGRKANKL